MSQPPPMPPADFYAPAPVSPKMGQLKIVGILLLVFASLDILANLYFVASVAVQVAGGHAAPPAGDHPPGFEGGYYVGFYSPLVLGIIALPLLALLIVCSVAMLRGKNFKLARIGAILAVIPFTASCCFITLLPFGIWALILLANPEVKDAFRNNALGQS